VILPGFRGRRLYADADEVSGTDRIRVADSAETSQLRELERIVKVVGGTIPQRITGNAHTRNFQGLSSGKLSAQADGRAPSLSHA
jgi:hypothetical protein